MYDQSYEIIREIKIQLHKRFEISAHESQGVIKSTFLFEKVFRFQQRKCSYQDLTDVLCALL